MALVDWIRCLMRNVLLLLDSVYAWLRGAGVSLSWCIVFGLGGPVAIEYPWASMSVTRQGWVYVHVCQAFGILFFGGAADLHGRT